MKKYCRNLARGTCVEEGSDLDSVCQYGRDGWINEEDCDGDCRTDAIEFHREKMQTAQVCTVSGEELGRRR